MKECNYLARYRSQDFDTWWDAEKFDWRDDSDVLAIFCHHHFEKWWDAEKYNWKAGSRYLAKYCSHYINIWWDAERFNWDDSMMLYFYCLPQLNVWWDADKIVKYFALKEAKYLFKLAEEVNLKVPEEELKKVMEVQEKER